MGDCKSPPKLDDASILPIFLADLVLENAYLSHAKLSTVSHLTATPLSLRHMEDASCCSPVCLPPQRDVFWPLSAGPPPRREILLFLPAGAELH
jgi:hypothetical protein